MLAGVLSGAPQALYDIKDIKRGRRLLHDQRSEVDYSHLLSPSFKRRFRLVVELDPPYTRAGTVVALLRSRTTNDAGFYQYVGSVRGVMEAGAIFFVEDAQLNANLRGKGAGKALYEALYREAYELGATWVKGGTHSSNAANVHRSLAAKHGWDYDALPNTVESGGRHGDGSRDDHWQSYSFQLRGVHR